MVPCRGTSIATLFLAIISTVKATSETKACHSCCENQAVKEGSSATLTFHTDFDLTASKNTILEVRRQTEHQLSPQPVLYWTTSNTQVIDGYKFNSVQNHTLIISIPYVNSSYAGKYSLSHSCVKIPIACQLDVRIGVQNNIILSKQCPIPESESRIHSNNTFHSCCENQAVMEGSSATLTFHTDFDLTASKNSMLEIRRQTEHQLSPQTVFQRTNSNTHVKDGYKLNSVQNHTLIISIPYVNSSYAGNYSLSHSRVKIPIACQLDVRTDVQSNIPLSKQCQIGDYVSPNAAKTNPFGGREDTGEYNLSKIIAPSVTIIVVIGVILPILYITRKNRYLCFRDRQNDTHGNGHESEEHTFFINITENDKEQQMEKC